MGDKRRFDLFAKLIKNKFPAAKKIADVAGGKGYLQMSMRELGYKEITTFDKRRLKQRNRKNFQFKYKYFSENIKDKFDLIVGMHPDEATDVIIVEACKRSIPFAVVPCCVKPSAIPFKDTHKYNIWMKHLELIATKRNYSVEKITLPMVGRNIVLIGKLRR